MAHCKRCGMTIDWGVEGDRFIPLVPIGEDEDLEKLFRDENMVPRAVHFLVCKSRPVILTRLAKPLKPKRKETAKKETVDPETGEIRFNEIPLEVA